MYLTEKTDIRRLQYLKYLIKEHYDDCMDEWFSKCKFKKDKETEMFKLNKYIETMLQNNGEHKPEYKHSQNSKKYGRLFASPSVQQISWNIRGFLFQDTTDVDFQNCHPKILEYICNKNGIMCPSLQYYNNNRKQILGTGAEKDERKVQILQIINSDYNKTYKDEFLKQFDKEMRTIRNKIIELECYKDIVDCVAKDKPNKVGSQINMIMCNYEAQLLEDMMEAIKSYGAVPSVRMFDGCLIHGDYYDDEEFIEKIQNDVNTKWEGLNIVITTKQHETTIDIPNDFEYQEEEKTLPSNFPPYEKVREEFEKTHAKIIGTSMFVGELCNKTIFYKQENLKVSYSHLYYTETITKKDQTYNEDKQFIMKWLKDPYMKTYRDVGLYPPPQICPDDEYNMWKPFEAEKITDYEPKIEDLNYMLNHMRVLCNHDEEVYEYFMKWTAQMIQRPAEKSPCITLISKQGAGKTTIIKLFELMMGGSRVLVSTNPKDEVFGKFNSLMVDSFFVNLNEISQKDTYEAEGRIKGLITDDRLLINPKGHQAFCIKSFHRWLITTNREEGGNKTDEDDRRNLIIRSSDELIGNREHFNRIYRMMEDKNFIATFYNYLKNTDLSGFQVAHKPVSKYQKELQEEVFISPVEMYIKHIVEQNYYEKVFEGFASDIYQEFKQFCKTIGNEHVENIKKFAFKIRSIDGIDVKRTNKGMYYTYDIAKLRTKYNMENLEDAPDETDDELEEINSV